MTIPSCRRCAAVDAKVLRQTMKDGRSVHLRVECRRCGSFIAFVPQTPENMARVEGDHSDGGECGNASQGRLF